MTVLKKGSKIISKIKKEIATEKSKVEKNQKITNKDTVIANDLGCSEANCSNYCSES